jgi:radical SAM enzyme (TIGR01210 family)
VEEERGEHGKVEAVATVFLTNKECPFQCLMCDLWKNTTTSPVKPGDIPAQIEWALARLPGATTIKLYNSANFFDVSAIPVSDYPAIAELVKDFKTVIVENHPRLINANTFRFQELLVPKLEIAMGLETVHPEILKKLNKKMTLSDFEQAVKVLNQHHMKSRAFILLRPPFLSEEEGRFWARQSVKFAFEAGVSTAIVIPTRYGNGALDLLAESGNFSPPDINSLECVLEYGIKLNAGNVFADLWDIEKFSKCSKCLEKRKERLHQMNLQQTLLPEVLCEC